MPENNKVSIIISVFNTEKYIADSINSVLRQTYRNLEIIIVDDGSTDSTGEIVDSFAEKDKRIIVIHQANSGFGGGRNTGIDRATGKYIAFLDADDWFEDDCIERTVFQAEKYNADIVFFNHYNNYSDGCVAQQVFPNKFLIYELDKKKQFWIYDMRLIHEWGKLYRRNCIADTRNDINIKISEDIDFNYRIYSKVNRAVYISDCLMHYRIQQKSAVHGYNPEIEFEFQYPLNKIATAFLNGNEDQKKAYYSFAAIAYIVICQNGIGLNQNITWFKKTKELRSFSEKSWVKDLFANIDKICIPISRKQIVLCGKYRLYSAVLMSIKAKQILGR